MLLLVVGMLLTLNIAAAIHDGKTEGFVCPVLNENAGENNPNAFPIANGDYSLIPSGEPKIISVPVDATNGNGEGSPAGDHAVPGDSDYTAIWNLG